MSVVVVMVVRWWFARINVCTVYVCATLITHIELKEGTQTIASVQGTALCLEEGPRR